MKAKRAGKPAAKPALENPLSNPGASHKKPVQIFGVEEANDRLYDLFRNHQMGHITHDQRKLLARFYEILMQNQKVNNFTRLTNLREIAIKHFIDCLIVPTMTELKFPLLDVGTGPGFPGIPLKILYPENRILLAEGVQKRVEFLKTVREGLGLKNLDIIGKNILTGFAYPVEGVITRAVEDARNTLRNVVASVKLGGKVYLMKGPNVDPELPVAQAEMGEFYELEQDLAYTLPGTPYDRRLLVYRKIKNPTLEWLDQWTQDEPFADRN
jgi:16S rRNA (guanine527-N7)-methyltransferase